MTTPAARHDTPGRLHAAIESLYAAFERYPLGASIVGCSHCTSEADDLQLRSKPLRQLGGDDLCRFAFKAITTLGTLDDYKHFLPRILELIANEGEVGGEPIEIILDKLHYGKWTNWPAAEQSAINEFFAALWQHALAEFPASIDIDNYLSGIAQAVDNVTPYLAVWRSGGDLPAARHLADFAVEHVDDLIRRDALSAFWREHPVPMRQAIDWLIDPATASHLEQILFNLPGGFEPIADELSQAVTKLDRLLASRGITRLRAGGIAVPK